MSVLTAKAGAGKSMSVSWNLAAQHNTTPRVRTDMLRLSVGPVVRRARALWMRPPLVLAVVALDSLLH